MIITSCRVSFGPDNGTVEVEKDSILLDAAIKLGLSVAAPCGAQGRCGRCKMKVVNGQVEQPPTMRLSPIERDSGYVLACQSRVQGDLEVEILPVEAQKAIMAQTVSDKVAAMPEPELPLMPAINRRYIEIDPPSLDDNTADLDRLRRSLALQHGVQDVEAGLLILKNLARRIREADWKVTVSLEEIPAEIQGLNGGSSDGPSARLVNLLPGDQAQAAYGLAVDIGTTTIGLFVVNLVSGEIVGKAAGYNGQLNWGEDVISRIIYSQRSGGLAQMQSAAARTINELVASVASRTGMDTMQIDEVVVAGNTTMTHLFLGVDPKYIREEPYIPVMTHVPVVTAADVGLKINPTAPVRAFPGVGSYVGGDITSGVLSSEMYKGEELRLFIDVGTNGEIVLGNADWLISCACSAGPAFEGGGVKNGMHAVDGAIDEVWIDARTYEPTYHVIGEGKPRGICGSGLIEVLADMFITGVIDKSGKINVDLHTQRTRIGENGREFVLAWASESATGQDIVLTEADINNLIRAKAAIYAGFSVLLDSMGLTFDEVHEILIAGGFGQYINVEKAIQIGFLPDLPWEKFRYLGNTSLLGAYRALLSVEKRALADAIGAKMTYLELSADNRFTDQYMSALFLPHTNLDSFPSVADLISQSGRTQGNGAR